MTMASNKPQAPTPEGYGETPTWFRSYAAIQLSQHKVEFPVIARVMQLDNFSTSLGVDVRPAGYRKVVWQIQAVAIAVKRKHPLCGDLTLLQRSLGQIVEPVCGQVLDDRGARLEEAIAWSGYSQESHES